MTIEQYPTVIRFVLEYESPHDKTNKMTVRPAKTQISLPPVWSKSSMCAQSVAKDPSFLHADSEDSDQTGRMPRLIWVFAGRTCHFVGFVMRRLMCKCFSASSFLVFKLCVSILGKFVLHVLQWCHWCNISKVKPNNTEALEGHYLLSLIYYYLSLINYFIIAYLVQALLFPKNVRRTCLYIYSFWIKIQKRRFISLFFCFNWLAIFQGSSIWSSQYISKDWRNDCATNCVSGNFLYRIIIVILRFCPTLHIVLFVFVHEPRLTIPILDVNNMINNATRKSNKSFLYHF